MDSIDILINNIKALNRYGTIQGLCEEIRSTDYGKSFPSPREFRKRMRKETNFTLAEIDILARYYHVPSFSLLLSVSFDHFLYGHHDYSTLPENYKYNASFTIRSFGRLLDFGAMISDGTIIDYVFLGYESP